MKDTIEMARESGFDITLDPTETPPQWFFECWESQLRAFEALVRADEREMCAKLAEKTICDTHIPTGINIYGTRVAKALRAKEQA
jgi:hypothetical protein